MTMPAADKIAAGSRIISSDFDQINRMKAIKNKKAEAVVCCFGLWCLSWRRPTFPHSYPCSIIGPARLNFRVRDGNGCDPRGMTTRKLELAYCLPSSSRAKDRERNNRNWLALQVRLQVEQHCAEKAVTHFLRFLTGTLTGFPQRRFEK